MMDLCSISTIKDIQKMFGFRNAKGLGQNFLTDPNVISDMVEAAGIGPEDFVIEIGPGIGVLTSGIAKKAEKVLAVEIDSGLIPVLKYTLGEFSNVEILNQDILKTDLKEIIEGSGKKRENIKIMGNLPYYITTPILTSLVENGLSAESITVMMQKEVGERIVADPGSKTYGALSVGVQFHSHPEEVLEVPKEAFFPAPKVDSCVIKLNLLEEPPVDVKDKAMFFRLVKAGFSQRRKTLRNSLQSGGFDKEIINLCLEEAEIEGERRAETLSLQDFARLSDAFTEKQL